MLKCVCCNGKVNKGCKLILDVTLGVKCSIKFIVIVN